MMGIINLLSMGILPSQVIGEGLQFGEDFWRNFGVIEAGIGGGIDMFESGEGGGGDDLVFGFDGESEEGIMAEVEKGGDFGELGIWFCLDDMQGIEQELEGGDGIEIFK